MSGAKESFKQRTFTDSEKQKDTRLNNIIAAKGVADVVRTSLGPRGMDKMVNIL
jgi:T-complex protein 1 subunit delta